MRVLGHRVRLFVSIRESSPHPHARKAKGWISKKNLQEEGARGDDRQNFTCHHNSVYKSPTHMKDPDRLAKLKKVLFLATSRQ